MKNILKLIGLCLMIFVISSFTFLFLSKSSKKNIAEPVIYNTNLSVPVKKTISTETDFTFAAKKTIDAVVHITNKSTSRGNQFGSLWDFFYNSPSKEYPRIGMGSGVIVSSDGYILTNNHVIEGANEIQVTTNDNKVFEAQLIGSDENADIAVLKIENEKIFPYIRFADSDQTDVGQWVLAVGNPYNLNSTVTAGIISAKSRDLSDYDGKNQSFIQTDAAVNSGNSGGALVNLEGDLIGINTAITSNGLGTFIGYSFAVPSNIARKIYEDLVEFGNVQKALLGVNGVGLNSRLSDQLNSTETEGFFVSGLEINMGAYEAGIKEKDVIIKVDNADIKKFSDLTGYLNTKRPGDLVNVTVIRDSEVLNFEVKLKKTPYVLFYGMRVRNMNENETKKFNGQNGLVISDLQNNRLYSRGIETGDILISINGNSIYDKEDLNKIELNSIFELEFMNKNGEKMRFIFE
ncbi:MAG: trypsin-like peptidase domain-containing protein [Bacteroidota bacterium]|nr:trypsin-like peptidase domain-containing protein [Bacteroidota bacterium]